jgi:hypothetical protein
MACQEEVSADGQSAVKDPHSVQAKMLFLIMITESPADGLALNWLRRHELLRVDGSE